jgi:hypothetical protein
MKRKKLICITYGSLQLVTFAASFIKVYEL